jgi:hypothetical protein
MDPKDLAILDGIGQWMKLNGESIRGTTRTPLAVQAWGESTRKDNTLYLHVFQWPANGELVVGGLKSPVKRAWLLGDAQSAPLPVTRLNPLDVRIRVPAAAPDPADSVVVVEGDGALAADAGRLLQPGLGANTLRVFDAELRGKGLRFGPGKTRDAYVENWSKTTESIAWPVRLNEAAAFDVTVVYDAPAGSAEGSFTVKTAAETLTGTVNAGTNVSSLVGRITMKPGASELQVAPTVINGGELMRLRSVVLAAGK